MNLFLRDDSRESGVEAWKSKGEKREVEANTASNSAWRLKKKESVSLKKEEEVVVVVAAAVLVVLETVEA